MRFRRKKKGFKSSIKLISETPIECTHIGNKNQSQIIIYIGTEKFSSREEQSMVKNEDTDGMFSFAIK